MLYRRIMGFDISSSVIGWSVFNIDKKQNISLIDSGIYKPSKSGHLFENLKSLKEDILELLIEHKPDKVAIEDVIQYMPRASSANTIIKLSLYNRIVGLTAYEYLEEPPELYSVMAIRHGIKLTKELPKKEEIPELVEKLLSITLTRQYKKTGAIRSELYDESDAIACGLFCCFKLTNKLEEIRRLRKDTIK